MNVSKIIKILLIFPFFCFSQDKEKDAYFILNENHKKYTLGNYINKSNFSSFGLNDSFSLYDRVEFNIRQKKVAQEKKEGKYNKFKYWGIQIPNTSTYTVISDKKEVVNHCDIHNLNIINYDWLIKNSWKENNPNILFKDLYFLIKTENNEFIKYKIARTVIAY